MVHSKRIIDDKMFIVNAVYHNKRFDLSNVDKSTPEWQLKCYINSIIVEINRKKTHIWGGKQLWKKDANEYIKCEHLEYYMLNDAVKNALFQMNRIRFRYFYFKQLNY